MKMNNRTVKLCAAGLVSLGLGLSGAAMAHSSEHHKPVQKSPPQDTKLKGTPATALSAQQDKPPPSTDPKDYVVDPGKRLTMAQFKKGINKLHGYLTRAVENGPAEDKKFLVKEKLEVERQLANPEAAYAQTFKSIDAQISRLTEIKIFPEWLIAAMNMYLLGAEPAMAMITMRDEGKKEDASDAFKAEMYYQLGLMAERDQVNFKTALRHYIKAVSTTTAQLDYFDALGQMYLTLGDNEDAAKLYKDMVANLTRLKAPAELIAKMQSGLDAATRQLKMVKK